MSYRSRNRTSSIRRNAHIRAARAAAGEHQPSGQGYPGPGTINAYQCTTCEQPTVVIHRDAGITPPTLHCRATPGCKGTAVSARYGTPADQLPPPTHEWFRPQDRQLAPGVRTHTTAGVLHLRKVSA